MILDLTGFHLMSTRDQEDWVELRWDDLCKELGVEFGATWGVKRFDPDHDHRIGFCDPDYGCCDDSLDALKLAVGVDELAICCRHCGDPTGTSIPICDACDDRMSRL